MKKLLLSTMAVAGLMALPFAPAQAEEDLWNMTNGYAVMQAGMGFGQDDYDKSGVFAVGGGYHLNRHFRSDVTVGMRAFGEVSSQGQNADTWSVPALLNLYMNIPWQKMGLYAMGGLGMSYNKVDSTSVSKSDSNVDFAWTVGGGIDYRLNKCWSLDLGYRYVDLGSSEAKLKSGAGKLKSDLRSHDILLSARYYF